MKTDPFVVKKNNEKDVNRNQASETVRTTSVSSIFIRFWQGKFDSLGCADNIATQKLYESLLSSINCPSESSSQVSQVSRSVEPNALEHSGSVNH